jgi:hypothetical protein
MGITYHYANLTKREWFPIDALGGGSKLNGLGRTLTARAFELLLVKCSVPSMPNDPVRVGRWAGDAIAVIGDEDDNWLQYGNEFTDLTADVILLLVSEDGFERIGSVAEEDSSLFLQLSYLAGTHQAPVLEPHMKQRFGRRYWRQYQDMCQHQISFKPKDVAIRG